MPPVWKVEGHWPPWPPSSDAYVSCPPGSERLATALGGTSPLTPQWLRHWHMTPFRRLLHVFSMPFFQHSHVMIEHNNCNSLGTLARLHCLDFLFRALKLNLKYISEKLENVSVRNLVGQIKGFAIALLCKHQILGNFVKYHISVNVNYEPLN